MSDIKEIINNLDEEEEIRQWQDKDFLAEQDQKFEELRSKLHSLKEENKRQMDIIINSLDSLMAEKNFIDKALGDLHLDDPSEPSVSVDKNFRVVDYLSKITGLDKDITEANSIFSKKAQSTTQQNLKNVSSECTGSKTVVDQEHNESFENVINKIEKCETDVINLENCITDIEMDKMEKEECIKDTGVDNECCTEKNKTCSDAKTSKDLNNDIKDNAKTDD